MIAGDWLSIYSASAAAGRGQLAAHLMRKSLKELVERLGKDDDTFLLLNADARILLADKSEWAPASAESLGLEGVGGVLFKRVGGPVPTRKP
jgi:hypothetical protein